MSYSCEESQRFKTTVYKEIDKLQSLKYKLRYIANT